MEVNAPSPPRMLGPSADKDSSLDVSEPSNPMMGTIWVSLLKGPLAALPKCGANVGIRATACDQHGPRYLDIYRR